MLVVYPHGMHHEIQTEQWKRCDSILYYLLLDSIPRITTHVKKEDNITVWVRLYSSAGMLGYHSGERELTFSLESKGTVEINGNVNESSFEIPGAA